jgi:hypothetical protein
MNRRALLALVLVALLVVPTHAAAATRGEPNLSLTLSDNRVEPGETAVLAVGVSNVGEIDISDGPAAEQRVTTARGLTLEMEGGSAPLEVRTQRVALGSLADGGFAAAEFEVDVDADAEPGTYRVPVTVSYTYTNSVTSTVTSTGRTISDYSDRDVSRTVELTVRVTEETRFEVVNASTDADIGGTGDVELTVENTGSALASDASLSLQSNDADLTFGGQPAAESYVGEWAPGERRTFSFSSEVAPDTERRSLGLTATISYEDLNGVESQTRLATGVVPEREQSFSVESSNATLRVGEEGTLSGTVTNDGPGEAENAVLVLQPTGSSIDAVESEYALGNLPAGESVAFEYEVDVSAEARDGPRQFSYRVEYEGREGTTEESDQLYARYDVGPQREVFEVSANATVDAGGTETLELEVTNNGDAELSDVSAKLFADSPISVGDDEAFIDSLPPGETETILFQISAAGTATAKVYPVSLDFQYDEPDGDTKLSDTYQVPVSVTESNGGGGGPLGGLGIGPIVLVVVLVLVGIGVVYWTRRS